MESLNNIEAEIEVGRRTYCIMADVTFVDEDTGELVPGGTYYSSEITDSYIVMEDRDKAMTLSSGNLTLEKIDSFTAKQKDLDFLKKAIEGKYRIPEGCKFFGIEPYVLLIQKNEKLPIILNSCELQKFAKKLSETRLGYRGMINPEPKIYLSRELNRVKLETYGYLINRIIDLVCKYRFFISEEESEEDKVFYDSIVRYDSHLAERIRNHDNFGTANADMELVKENIFAYYPEIREMFIRLNKLESDANQWRLRRTYNGQQAYYDIKTKNYVLINGNTTETIKQLEYYPLEYIDSITLMFETSTQFDRTLDMLCCNEYSSDENKATDSEVVYQYFPDSKDEDSTKRRKIPRFDLVSIDGRELPALFKSDQNIIKLDNLQIETKQPEPQPVEEPVARPISSISVGYIDPSLPDFVQDIMFEEMRAKQVLQDGLVGFRDTPLVVRTLEEEKERSKEEYTPLEIESSDEDKGCLQMALGTIDGVGICDINKKDEGQQTYLVILSILKYANEKCTPEQLKIFRTISQENPTEFDYKDKLLISNVSKYERLRYIFTIARGQQKLSSPYYLIGKNQEEKEQLKTGIARMVKNYNPPARDRVRAEEL